VISANKGPIAWDLRRLKKLASENNCLFYYETTVMDGTPVFNLYDETLKMCKVTGIKGILNSTTNYILDEMAKGIDYDAIIEEGKRRGFVEADSSMDIEGWDASAKLTVLMNILMDANINPKDIVREGISDVSYDNIKDAEASGKKIKLMCYTEPDENGKILGYVQPMEVDKDSLYATISGTTSVVSISTDLMGVITIIEHDPEIEQTAYGPFSDLLRILSGMNQDPVQFQ
jgi:homoserine dehydrogenase